MQGKTIKVGGIGEVSTKEKYQRRGLAARLMEAAVQYSKERQVRLPFIDPGHPRFFPRPADRRADDAFFVTAEWPPSSVLQQAGLAPRPSPAGRRPSVAGLAGPGRPQRPYRHCHPGANPAVG